MAAGTLPEAIASQAYRQDATVTFGTSPRRETLHYPLLAERIAAAAGGFAAQGVRPGDRVLLRISSSRDGVLALLGLMHLGAVPVSVKPRVPGTITGQYTALVARQQGARHAYRISGPGLREISPMDDARPVREPAQADPEDIAFVQYSSGSTGMPRPIPLSHRALVGNTEAIRAVAGMRPGHSGLIALPLHHDMGLVGLLTGLAGALNVVVEEPGTFLRRPMAALRLVRDAPAVHSALPDFMLRYLAARIGEAARADGPDPGLLRRWHTVFSGAEPIRRDSVRDFLAATGPWGFPPSALVFCYGLAEAGLMATSHRYTDEAPNFAEESATGGAPGAACLGAPVPGLDLEIVDEHGGRRPEGELGTVRLRGRTLFNGYDGATDHRVQWFDTGDLGRLRAGRLYLHGRRGDRVSVNGVNVFVVDIEHRATTEPGVAECVALAHEDGFTVLVVPERTATVDTAAVAAGIAADFGVAPRAVLQVKRGGIARTASGKPARTHMTAQLEKGIPFT
ncbi:AMP-binding protein [Streptomyces sp. NPDC088124]|uniref:AMP-binding protein n=1 Tax=Streptomyces sp. NPDC088124 TaxID=3154654 RepID=UPI0034260AEE